MCSTPRQQENRDRDIISVEYNLLIVEINLDQLIKLNIIFNFLTQINRYRQYNYQNSTID